MIAKEPPSAPSWADPESFSPLLDKAREFAGEYIDSLGQRPVFPPEAALQAINSLNEPLSEISCDPALVLKQLHEIGSRGAVNQTAGRYFGFVNGGMLPVGLAARWLGDAWDQNTAHYVMSPIDSRLEEICERWIASLLRLPDETAAGFVSGTTIANFSGLCAGRNELLRQRGWDVTRKGLYGAPRLRVIVGTDAHAAVHKSISMLGLGSDSVELVPSDDQGRMRPDQMPRLDEGALVIAQAGNVNSGAIDPVGAICECAHAAGSWVHVDGAFGLWARVVPSMREICDGIENADSWSVDAHKTLNVPYDSGMILCRHREALMNAFKASASYFQWSEHRDGMNFRPSMSSRARAIELWAVLKTLGRQGVQRLVEQLCENAREFARLLAEQGFQIHNDVVFNQVLVSCENDALTKATLNKIQALGECWCGGSSWRGNSVIRISVCDWATTQKEIERSVRAFVAARTAAVAEV
ncbi:MAG TPA: aminotransferase class V-fold PLP-dependent enzyme [Candidatus Tectomicrobia bacterium]|nr:aminotransferase class V-fold PLP-dependent enzyme [Candidatus Tectomicrobia bacterium]